MSARHPGSSGTNQHQANSQIITNFYEESKTLNLQSIPPPQTFGLTSKGPNASVGTTWPLPTPTRVYAAAAAVDLDLSSTFAHYSNIELTSDDTTINFTNLIQNRATVFHLDITINTATFNSLTFNPTLFNIPTLPTTNGSRYILEITAYKTPTEETYFVTGGTISTGGGGVSFPIIPPVSVRGNVNTNQNIDLSLTTAHSTTMTLTGDIDITFSNFPTSGNQIEWEVEVTQDGTGGHVITWPAEVVNPPSLTTGAGTIVVIVFRTNDNGTTVRVGNTVTTTSTGGVGSLSLLTIDVNKDWLAQGISNLGALTGVTAIDMDGATPLIQGVKEIRFLDDDPNKNIQSAIDEISYNTAALDQHSFYAGGIEILRIEEAASTVYRLNMLDHQILNIKHAAFDVGASFSGSGAVPTIGYDAASADFIFNSAAASSFSFTFNGTERMNLSDGNLTFADGTLVIFNPNSTNPGVNIGQVVGNPSSTTNGGMWYNATTNKLRTKENNVDVDVISVPTGFATTELDNLGTTAINADLLFGGTGIDIGTVPLPLHDLFVETVRLQSGSLVNNQPTITSVGGNSVDINHPTGSGVNFSENGATAAVIIDGGGLVTSDNIIIQDTLTINNSTANPTADGQFTRNVSTVGLQADSFDVRRDSVVTSGEPAELKLRKLADSILINVEIATISFQTGISTATTWGDIGVGTLVASGADASFLSLRVRADNNIVSAVTFHGDDNNQRIQMLMGGSSQARIQPGFDRMGYFVTPQVTDFSLNIGTAGSLEIPRLANNSPSLTDLNQAFGAFDGAFGYESVDERLYVRESSTRWVFFDADGAVT